MSNNLFIAQSCGYLERSGCTFVHVGTKFEHQVNQFSICSTANRMR